MAGGQSQHKTVLHTESKSVNTHSSFRAHNLISNALLVRRHATSAQVPC